MRVKSPGPLGAGGGAEGGGDTGGVTLPGGDIALPAAAGGPLNICVNSPGFEGAGAALGAGLGAMLGGMGVSGAGGAGEEGLVCGSGAEIDGAPNIWVNAPGAGAAVAGGAVGIGVGGAAGIGAEGIGVTGALAAGPPNICVNEPGAGAATGGAGGGATAGGATGGGATDGAAGGGVRLAITGTSTLGVGCTGTAAISVGTAGAGGCGVIGASSTGGFTTRNSLELLRDGGGGGATGAGPAAVCALTQAENGPMPGMKSVTIANPDAIVAVSRTRFFSGTVNRASLCAKLLHLFRSGVVDEMHHDNAARSQFLRAMGANAAIDGNALEQAIPGAEIVSHGSVTRV
jgi:hypothetical protein